jgi:hypothetical protein
LLAEGGHHRQWFAQGYQFPATNSTRPNQ